MDSLLRFSFATADSKYNDNTLHRTRATGREARAAQGSFSFALVSQLRWFRVCVPTSMDNIIDNIYFRTEVYIIYDNIDT